MTSDDSVSLELYLFGKDGQSPEEFEAAYDLHRQNVLAPLLQKSPMLSFRSSIRAGLYGIPPSSFFHDTQFADAASSMMAKEIYHFRDYWAARDWLDAASVPLGVSLKTFIDAERSAMAPWNADRQVVKPGDRSVLLAAKGRVISWIIRCRTTILSFAFPP